MIIAGPVTFRDEDLALILGVLALVALLWLAVNYALVAFGVALGHLRAGHRAPSTHSRGAMVIATLVGAATPLGVSDAAPSLVGTVGIVVPGLVVAFALGVLIGALGSGGAPDLDDGSSSPQAGPPTRAA